MTSWASSGGASSHRPLSWIPNLGSLVFILNTPPRSRRHRGQSLKSTDDLPRSAAIGTWDPRVSTEQDAANAVLHAYSPTSNPPVPSRPQISAAVPPSCTHAESVPAPHDPLGGVTAMFRPRSVFLLATCHSIGVFQTSNCTAFGSKPILGIFS
ncbi:hypothetical protein CKAH01_17747 [Colletotrichum kahawae]|uniref:Uncharacterized protein n=1 Tax=Colletotrichum kahawae TaxID=34407 RepID=A0AAD9YAY7_COLKA|nr:hypothetical protein CKAH01_17747 [Colletotrichum kahawae]